MDTEKLYLLIWAASSTVIVFSCFGILYFYARRTKNFRWSEYLAFIGVGFLPLTALSYLEGSKVWLVFLLYAFVGSLCEYLVGFLYHQFLNKKLWVYQKYSISGYTSLLSVPLWGIGGFIFWFLGKIIGL